jgi:hypothetical protein
MEGELCGGLILTVTWLRRAYLGLGSATCTRSLRCRCLDLDLAPQDAHPPKQTVSRTSGTLFLPNNKRVFVVDNDPGMLRAVARLLTQHGYDPVLFLSAEAFKSHNDFEKAVSGGAAILLVLRDTGDWEPPFAIWYPPYPDLLESGCV